MPARNGRGGKRLRRPMPPGGRKPKSPFEIEPVLDRYLAKARTEGLELHPLDFKSVARAIKEEGKEHDLKCSHTHFSPKGIEAAPKEYRAKWEELRARVLQTREQIEGRSKTALERLEEEVVELRARLDRSEREKEQLWIWMLQIETSLQADAINTEMFVPEDLRYGRNERRQTTPDQSTRNRD